MMKRIWKRFLLNIEIYSYYRVLNECHSILTAEQRNRIFDEIDKAKQKITA
jgi:hypothetical protein